MALVNRLSTLLSFSFRYTPVYFLKRQPNGTEMRCHLILHSFRAKRQEDRRCRKMGSKVRI
jgi:hypothetical protein